MPTSKEIHEAARDIVDMCGVTITRGEFQAAIEARIRRLLGASDAESKLDADGRLDGVEVMYERNGVLVVNICRLLDHLYGEDRYNFQRSYQAERDLVQRWANNHDGHVYAAPREEFSTWKASCEAAQAGKSVVVVEDLS